jgi:hypothetical protein
MVIPDITLAALAALADDVGDGASATVANRGAALATDGDAGTDSLEEVAGMRAF